MYKIAGKRFESLEEAQNYTEELLKKYPEGTEIRDLGDFHFMLGVLSQDEKTKTTVTTVKKIKMTPRREAPKELELELEHEDGHKTHVKWSDCLKH